VFKALYCGEVVAAKEIRIDHNEEVQQAFVAVSKRVGGGGGWGSCQGWRAGECMLHRCVELESNVQHCHTAKTCGGKPAVERAASGAVGVAADWAAASLHGLHMCSSAGAWYLQEALQLQHLRHGHVVNFYGVSLDGSGHGIILMEFCEGEWCWWAGCRQLSSAGSAAPVPQAHTHLGKGSRAQGMPGCARTAATPLVFAHCLSACCLTQYLTTILPSDAHCSHAGRDLGSVLQLRSSRTHERIFGWHRSGRRVAVEVARAINWLHSKVIEWLGQ